MGVTRFEHRQNLCECRAGINHVIDEQPSGSGQRAGTAQRIRDPQGTLLCAGCLAVGAGKEHAQRRLEHSRQNIPNPKTAPSQAHDGIKTPARLMHLYC